MPAGRPPKPLKLLEASGALKKNPQRYRDRTPEPSIDAPLGPPPADWAKRAKDGSGEYTKLVQAWEKITARIALLPDGLVTAADDITVELTCRLLVRVEGGWAKPGDLAHLRALLGELGLSPGGRARRQGHAASGDSEFGDFDEFRSSPARRSA